MADFPHPPHPGHHWPYDPVRHHHPGHPPFMVDRCADECDDQLPLFSQVGRGLQGDGYQVVIHEDQLAKTILKGLIKDPRTGKTIEDWRSENINGGHLSFGYTYRPWTDPTTFVISFRYERPGRYVGAEGENREAGTVWSWVSPAIPYVWNEVDKNIGSGVATLYLKKLGEAWNWRKHEKLVYPPNMDHNSMNAPDPLEPYTVNLTYGIGEGSDFEVPSIDDIAKIIGITPEQIKRLVKQEMPTDTFPSDMNVKKYIDSIKDMIRYYDVVSTKPGALTVSSEPVGNNTTKFKLTPIAPTAGQGIVVSTNPDTGAVTIGADIIAGPGIQIQNEGNSLKIVNSQVGGNWISLTPASYNSQGLVAENDFTWIWHNGWFGGVPSVGTPSAIPSKPAKENQYPPRIRIQPSYNKNGELIGARVRISAPEDSSAAVVNQDNLILKNSGGDLTKFMFHHSNPVADTPLSHILGIAFKGDYADLNNLPLRNSTPEGSSIWNIRGTNDDDITSANARWANCGACWSPILTINKNIEGRGTFLLAAAGISDGYNDQYDTPQYGYSALCVKPWANFDYFISIGN